MPVLQAAVFGVVDMGFDLESVRDGGWHPQYYPASKQLASFASCFLFVLFYLITCFCGSRRVGGKGEGGAKASFGSAVSS